MKTPRLHQAIYRGSRGGCIGRRLIGRPTLLLTTRRRRTGRERTNALIFCKDGRRGPWPNRFWSKAGVVLALTAKHNRCVVAFSIG
ncbi:MAG: nitroreductase/quinone reductase family protein [Acidimicrobiia bacterium]